jgi:hypothetical protein
LSQEPAQREIEGARNLNAQSVLSIKNSFPEFAVHSTPKAHNRKTKDKRPSSGEPFLIESVQLDTAATRKK